MTDVLILTLHLRRVIETIRNSGGRRLVDDTEYVETRDGTGILRRLTLGIIEISRHGDDGVVDLLTEEGLGGLLHLREDHSLTQDTSKETRVSCSPDRRKRGVDVFVVDLR
jgi:hypothetical protein